MQSGRCDGIILKYRPTPI